MSNPKLNLKEEPSAKKTRSPPKKTKVEQSVPKKKKLKTDADKAAEKAQHLRFGKRQSFWQKMNLFPLSQKSVITVWAIQSVWTVRILRSKLSEL